MQYKLTFQTIQGMSALVAGYLMQCLSIANNSSFWQQHVYLSDGLQTQHLAVIALQLEPEVKACRHTTWHQPIASHQPCWRGMEEIGNLSLTLSLCPHAKDALNGICCSLIASMLELQFPTDSPRAYWPDCLLLVA